MKDTKSIKLTQEEVDEKLAALVAVQLDINAKSKAKKDLNDQLADEFTRNEKKYRKGVETASGFFRRVPHGWDIIAKPIVEVA